MKYINYIILFIITITILFYINNNRFSLIDKLVERGSDLNKQDSNGMTAMMHAIEKSNINAVGMLARKKFNVSIRF